MASVQIVGLEDFITPDGRKKKTDRLYKIPRNIPSVDYLLQNAREIVGLLPEGKRTNIYYTAAICGDKRALVRQEVIPFDIDDIDVTRVREYMSIIYPILGVTADSCAVIFSGGGLQFICPISEPIEDEDYFDRLRIYYKAIIGRINSALRQAKLPGEADPSVFSKARLLRLPDTNSSKPEEREDRLAYLIEGTAAVEKAVFSIYEASGIPIVAQTDQVAKTMMARMPAADPAGVQEGCDFLKYCYANQSDVTEPQWYAMLSIIGRLPTGRTLAHQYSKDHPSYDDRETEEKLDQALTASGPRTCKNIESLWDGCTRCPNYDKCVSPITLRSARFIRTQDTGFYNVNPENNKIGKPNYDDLVEFFSQQNPYVSLRESGDIFTYNKKYWELFPKFSALAFAERQFNPSPNSSMCAEFHSKLQRTNLVDGRMFIAKPLVNFSNGTLELDGLTLRDHRPDDGFKYCLPYDYDPDATAPRFDRFLDEVTLNDPELKAVILEYMGYAICGIDASVGQKALILTGEGANGKSVLLDVLKYLVGPDAYSSSSLSSLLGRPENRHLLDGKLFNVSEEVPANALMDSSIFKALVTGGEVEARRLYSNMYSLRNNAKIIMACNELPKNSDTSYGLERRLLILPFRATFRGKDQDLHLRQKLYKEAPGIYNLVLKAAKRFLRNGGFTGSEQASAILEAYKTDNNPAGQWFFQNIRVDDRCEVSLMEMYKKYSYDMPKIGERPLPMNWFRRKLNTHTPEAAWSRRKDGAYLVGYALINSEETQADY